MRYLFLIYYSLVEKYIHFKRIEIFLKNNATFKKPVIFDVGAYKGDTVKLFSKIFNQAKIFYFEPNFNSFKILLKLKSNRINTFNYALGNKNQSRRMNLSSIDMTYSLSTLNKNSFYLKIKNFISNNKNKLKKSDRVRVIKLDNFCKKKRIKKIDIIKIDTEGHEYNVLLGSKKTLSNINYLIIEIQKHKMYKNYSIKKIESILKKNNFVLIKTFKFPLMFFEDRVYKKINK